MFERHRTLIVFLIMAPSLAFGHGGHTHGKKPKKGSKPSSEHQHDDGGFEFSLGLGAGISQPLTAPPTETTASSVKSGGLKLHDDGHDHGDSGGGGGSTDASFYGYLFGGVSYSIFQGFSLGINESVDVKKFAYSDPSIFASYSQKFARRLSGSVMGSFTVPISQASKDSYKITTVSLAAGPKYTYQKFSFGLQGAVAMSWYKKTIVPVDNMNTANGLTERSMMLHGDEDHSGHGDTPVVAGATGNREFNRYTLRGLIGYQLFEAIRLDANAGISQVKKQYGEPYWNFDATILQVTYGF